MNATVHPRNVISTFAPLAFVLGYLALISYTLPHGIAPVVNLQFLPTLILGSIAILMSLYIMQWILFAPFLIALYPRKSVILLTHDGLDLQHVLTLCRIIIRRRLQIFKQAKRWPYNYRFFFLCVGLIQFFVIIGIAFATWIALYKYSVDHKSFVISGLWMFGVFYSITVSLQPNVSIEKRIVSFFFVFILVVLVPIFPGTTISNHESKLVPNSLVKESLRIVGSGGGRIVRFSDDHNKLNRLIFYDGNRAWYFRCDNDIELRVTTVNHMIFDARDRCP